MSLARLVVTGVRLEGRTVSEVARDYDVSRQWVYTLLARYDTEGEAGLEPRSRRPHGNTRAPRPSGRGAHRRAAQTADRRWARCWCAHHRLAPRTRARPGPRTLDDLADPGPSRVRHPRAPQAPKSSYIRFAADQPNERWQADATHWQLADGTEVEILNILDDHSRLLIGSVAHPPSPAPTSSTTSRPDSNATGCPHRC
jgi:hypothetical protein